MNRRCHLTKYKCIRDVFNSFIASGPMTNKACSGTEPADIRGTTTIIDKIQIDGSFGRTLAHSLTCGSLREICDRSCAATSKCHAFTLFRPGDRSNNWSSCIWVLGFDHSIRCRFKNPINTNPGVGPSIKSASFFVGPGCVLRCVLTHGAHRPDWWKGCA